MAASLIKHARDVIPRGQYLMRITGSVTSRSTQIASNYRERKWERKSPENRVQHTRAAKGLPFDWRFTIGSFNFNIGRCVSNPCFCCWSSEL
ncbi:hypothetical protein TNIN_243501 [Trichonephila inaurata madagascariensis]|uniref:Uncharacterized protein n=1 Tax=Trichonephila inaurata madagascariensis TaxID=2747483 RepID=A0A8X6JDH3_9ARAC|nr:hypothetical protein TNIN_243501 [Trichonephila inaurata madagascariensis]